MKELILLRGIPGCGKSTLAKLLANGAGSQWFEADQYFVDDNGYYNFDATKLKFAHGWCRDEVEYAMQFGHRGLADKLPLSRIIVSNTFTQEWEMEPYYELANKYGYTVFSLIVENRHGGVNQHGVPDSVLDKMQNRFHIKLK